MYRILLLVSSALFCIAILACGDSGMDKSTSPGQAATSAPVSAKKAAPDVQQKVAPSVEQISAEGTRCLDLVKKQQYVEAIDPCKRALQESTNADVKRAYNEAVAAVQQQAQATAAKAAAGSLSGKPTGEAAKDAVGDTLGKFGTE